MRYFAIIENGYILSIGKGQAQMGTEISQERYDEILIVIKACPKAQDTGYRLKEDLTWESYHIDPPEPSEEIDAAEAYEILVGGAE